MRSLFGARARLRWVHLVLGGALLMPYFLVGSVAVGPFLRNQNVFTSLRFQLLAYAVALPLAAVSALFPLTRPMSVAAVRAMCGVPAGQLADGPARSRAARLRTSAWYTLHVGLGALVSGMTLALPPMAAVLIVLPLFPRLRDPALGLPEFFGTPAGLVLAPVIGLASLSALAACAAAAGALLARLAPVLLGPTPADRLAAAEERAADLAVRNRLARELHDSVGHALSAVSLQASAARRVLDSDSAADRDFVREALAAIEETTRRTVGELDTVLGLLREGDEARETAPAPTLAGDLAGLLARTRAAGVTITDRTGEGLAALPPVVSREAYRIVQEGLSNALRHGGAAPVDLDIAVTGEELEITMTNRLTARPAAAARATGGRGLRGAAERAALLGGRTEAGPRDGAWCLTARLPIGGPALGGTALGGPALGGPR
ncbi:sensor histidine kinase [Streptomyces sp. SYSU K217416]